MLFYRPGEDDKIVQVYHCKLPLEGLQYKVHRLLECAWYAFQTNLQSEYPVQSGLGCKCRFVLDLFVSFDLQLQQMGILR